MVCVVAVFNVRSKQQKVIKNLRRLGLVSLQD